MKTGSCARYFVEELIGGVQEEEWIDSFTMEIRRRASVSGRLRAQATASQGGMCNSEQFVCFLRCNLQVEDTMNWKPQDWIEHASFGLGRVNENRGDRLDIDFINSASKTILRTTELKPAISPADFKLPKVKRKSLSPRIKAGV